MSIYRNRDRFYGDVHATEAIKEQSAQRLARGGASDTVSEQRYRTLRKAAPATTLLPRTAAWVASLRPETRPTVLMRDYPRIANVLAATWGDPRAFRCYMESLMTDSRGNRRGFSPGVLRELGTLALLHSQSDSERRGR